MPRTFLVKRDSEVGGLTTVLNQCVDSEGYKQNRTADQCDVGQLTDIGDKPGNDQGKHKLFNASTTIATFTCL